MKLEITYLRTSSVAGGAEGIEKVGCSVEINECEDQVVAGELHLFGILVQTLNEENE